MNAYSHWSAQDWVAHYGATPQAQAGDGSWDAYGRRLSVYATGQSYAQRAQQTVEHLAERGERTVQGAFRSATSPKMLLAGVAALGILGWVIVQSGKTVGRTVVGVAPHAAKALPLLF